MPSQSAKQEQATPQVTSAAEWKAASRGFVQELPSGLVVRLRRTMNIMSLIKAGRIPNPLGAIIAEMIRTKGEMDFSDISAMDTQAIPQLFELIDTIVAGSMVEPKTVIPYVAKDASQEEVDKEQGWECPEDSITTDDIDMIDKMFVFRVAMGGAADLISFRKQLSESVADAQHGEDVPQPTKRASRART